MKYKKGDWVIIISKGKLYVYKQKIGEIFQVYEDCNSERDNVYFARNASVYNSRVRLCEPHEIPEEFRNKIVEDFPFC